MSFIPPSVSAALRRTLRSTLRSTLLFLLALLLAIALGGTSAGDRLEQVFSDLRLTHFGAPAESSPVVVVVIDEAALDLIGPWPWPRSVTAQLIDTLFERYAPAVVGLDMVFPPGFPEKEDAALAAALADRPVIIGQLFMQEPGERGKARYQPIDAPAGFPRFPGVLASSARLGQPEVGHINALIDADGKMRRILPAACDMTGCAPALTARLIGALVGAEQWRLEPGTPSQSRWRLVPGDAPELALPLDENLTAIIPWHAEPAHRYVSAADVWRGEVARDILQNRVILIGATAPALGDRVNTPVGANLPGVETHARLLGAWLDGRIPYKPDYIPLFLGAAWLIQTVVLMCMRQRGRLLLLAGVILALSVAALNLWLYHSLDIQLPLAAPFLYPLLLGMVLALVELYSNRRWILAQLANYLPAPLIRHFRDHTPDPAEETCWTTVMYADLIGSTAVSRHMSPGELAHWSNRAVDLVVQEITARAGVVDNIAGDGLMVYWREASPAEQARRALESALAIREGLAHLNATQRSDWPPLRMGIGLHAGPLLAGSFGQLRRRYTILGEVANLAFRIERQTRKLPARELASAAVAGQAHGIALAPAAIVELDGCDEPMQLFALADDQNTQTLQYAAASQPHQTPSREPASTALPMAAEPRIASRTPRCARRPLLVLASLALLASGTVARADDWEDWLAGIADLPPQAALQKLQQAPGAYQRRADYHYWLGVNTLKIGATAQAIEHFEQALMLDPDHAGAWYDYGLAHCRAGDRASCTAILEEAQDRFGPPPALENAGLPRFMLSGEVRSHLGYSSNLNAGTQAQRINLWLNGQSVPLALASASRAQGASFADGGIDLRITPTSAPEFSAALTVYERAPLQNNDMIGDYRLYAGELSYAPAPDQRIGLQSYRMKDTELGALNGTGLWWLKQYDASGTRTALAAERRRPTSGLPAYHTLRAEAATRLWRTLEGRIGFEDDLPNGDRPGHSQRRLQVGLLLPLQIMEQGRLEISGRWLRARDTDTFSPLFGDTRRWMEATEVLCRIYWPLAPQLELHGEARYTRQRSNIDLFAYSERMAMLGLAYRF